MSFKTITYFELLQILCGSKRSALVCHGGYGINVYYKQKVCLCNGKITANQ